MFLTFFHIALVARLQIIEYSLRFPNLRYKLLPSMFLIIFLFSIYYYPPKLHQPFGISIFHLDYFLLNELINVNRLLK